MFRTHVASMSGYVPGEQPRGAELIKLNTNENPYPCSPRVKAAIGRAVQTGLNRYPDPMANEFREAAARVLAADLPPITRDWILCGNGSDDLLTILTRSFVDQGGLIRYPRPSYVLYGTLAAIQGAAEDVVDFTSDWRLDERFTAPADGLSMVLLANPNSPSGTRLSADQVRSIATALPCPLVVDEAYVDFSQGNCLSLVAECERIIVTRTLSKSYGLAGLRFGYAVAQPHVIAQLTKVKDSYNCDTLAIAGATAAIEDRAWFSQNRAAVLDTRARLDRELAALGFEGCRSEANFLWRQHVSNDSRKLYEWLKSKGVLVRYMDYGSCGDGIRISVGTDEQIDRLLHLLRIR
jgi:histidinol-phosphate aminotransferase